MTKPVTILHVRNSIAYGGVETSMLGWLNNVDRSRFNCPVALFTERNDAEAAFRNTFRAHGHRVISVPWHPGRQFRKAVATLEQHIHETDAKLLHTHDWRSDVIGWHAARRAGIPIMTTIYVWFRHPLATRIKEAIDSFYIRKFDRVTAVCKATLCQTVDRGVAKEKTEVLISGMDPSRTINKMDREIIRARFGLTNAHIAFVYVARFYREKAHATLIEAFREVVARHPQVRLLLLGKGPLEKALHEQIAAAGLTEQVLMPGFVEDVPTVLTAMDIMVHASLAEGIPLALYEGMLAGLPTIGSDVDGNPEVVIPQHTGWLVPPGNMKALRNALFDALQQKDLWETYGDNARSLIMSEYSISHAVTRLQTCWQKIIQHNMEPTA